MKKLINISTLFSMTVLFMLTACVQEESQSHATLIPNDDAELSNRGDCDDCPGANECCCILEYLGNLETYYSICGTSDGDAVTCEIDPSPCEYDIDGLEHTFFYLDNYELFCMNESMAFMVQRASMATGTTYFRVSCTREGISPQWVYFSLTDDERITFEVDGDCLISGPCI